MADAIDLGLSTLAQILHPLSLCRRYAALEYVTCAGCRYVHLCFRPDRNFHLQGKSLSLALPFGLHATSHRFDPDTYPFQRVDHRRLNDKPAKSRFHRLYTAESRKQGRLRATEHGVIMGIHPSFGIPLLPGGGGAEFDLVAETGIGGLSKNLQGQITISMIAKYIADILRSGDAGIEMSVFLESG